MPPPAAEGFAARLVLGPALRTQPDRRLVTLVGDGYETAFEEIVRRYGKPLTRYAAAIVGGRAEDVTQDAFSKALLALRRDGAEIELRPWLFRIVRNTALNDLRDRPPSAEALAEAIAGGRDPAEELERREELTDLMRRLQSLPEPQRAAIVMRELEGLSHEEIATALGLSGGAARQAIYRARQALRDGAGMLLPLPLLKALLAGTATAPVEAAAGTAGLGGAAGAGVALKAATATVLVASAVGAGVAIDHSHRGDGPAAASARGIVAENSSAGAAANRGEGASSAESHAGPGDRGGGRTGGRGGGDSSGGNRAREAGGSKGGEAAAGTKDHGGSRGAGGHRGGHHSAAGDDHGGHSGSPDQVAGGGDEHRSDLPADGSSGPGGDQSGGGDGQSGSGDSTQPSGGSGDTGSSEGSDSNSGPDSGDGGGENVSNSGDSGDSLGGDGFSVQTEPQTQEDR